MDFFYSISTYDIICCFIILLAILYGMEKGLLSMLKPVIAVIIARFLSSYIRNIMSSGDISAIVAQIASEKTGISTEYEFMQMGTQLVSESIISVLSFVLSYILIRIALTLVFSVLKIRRRSILFKFDKYVGGAISFIVVCLFIYYVGIGSTALANIGFTNAAELSEGLANSFVPSKILSFTGDILNDIKLT